MYRKLLLGLTLTLLLSACRGQETTRLAAGPHIWIDAPLSGAEVPPGINIQVVAYVSAPGNVTQMSLLIGGAPVGTMVISPVKEGLVRGEGVWTPPGPGRYSLSVQAIVADGASATSDPVLLVVTGEGPVAGVPPVTVTPTVTPTLPPSPVIKLMADSTSLTAGSCTFLRWGVYNVQPQSIELNGQPVASEGEQQVCPCQTTTYDLIVLAEDKYVESVTINVTGECVMPTLPPPQREIFFQADPPTIPAGGCTTLSWKNPDVQSTTLNGKPVEWYGSQQVCGLCAPQTYNLEVVWPDGTRDARTLTVNVTGSCVTPTATPTQTPTPTAFPQATINFWADATMIPAGTCTTIHWQTANVRAVYFNGQGVAGEGTYQACPNTTCEIYTLDVVLQDGSHDIRTLTICLTVSPPPSATPPPQDTTPPPAPASLKPGSTDPAHPQDLDSCSPVVLRWQPVTDRGGSGLQGYRVSLQRNNNGQWQSIEPYFIIYETGVDVTQWLEAGWDYRWNVWAIDNAGNDGAPSAWRYFGCPLE
ncbi:MAG: hypothetical protein NUW24_07220 [Anaerolineae bacterium]|jgi:uncharacterized Zn-binding protein involved in type VI secretion|nr:hypothetical protein [Anaerolineae bacterium]MDH7475510.1 hypothetical protein [Anaerolineae bacterium]